MIVERVTGAIRPVAVCGSNCVGHKCTVAAGCNSDSQSNTAHHCMKFQAYRVFLCRTVCVDKKKHETE